MCTKDIKNFQLFKVSLTAGISTYQWQPDAELSQNTITKIEAFDADLVSNAPEGEALCTNAVLKKGYLQIVDVNQNTVLNQMPLINLRPQTSNGNDNNVANLNFKNKVNVTKCQVKFSDSTGITTGQVLLLGIYFDKNY